MNLINFLKDNESKLKKPYYSSDSETGNLMLVIELDEVELQDELEFNNEEIQHNDCCIVFE